MSCDFLSFWHFYLTMLSSIATYSYLIYNSSLVRFFVSFDQDFLAFSSFFAFSSVPTAIRIATHLRKRKLLKLPWNLLLRKQDGLLSAIDRFSLSLILSCLFLFSFWSPCNSLFIIFFVYPCSCRCAKMSKAGFVLVCEWLIFVSVLKTWIDSLFKKTVCLSSRSIVISLVLVVLCFSPLVHH